VSRLPRFSIRWQISLISLILVAIPFLGWRYWQDVRNTLLSAQSRIQESEARVIANTLLATQTNLRELLAADTDAELQKYALSAPPVRQAIRLDGFFGDWPPRPESHEPFKHYFTLWQANPDGYHETAMDLQLAQSEQHLYVGIRVRDHQRVYRDRSHLRLNDSDHIQFTYVDAHDQLQRVIIPAEKEGPLASYYTDIQWQYGRDIIRPDSDKLIPSHKTELQGFWRKTDEGYAIEFRMPLNLLETRPTRLHFAVIDVDEHADQGPQAIIATLPDVLSDQLNPVAIHARELQRVIDRLQNSFARLWILDRMGREWAYAERQNATDTSYLMADSPASGLVADSPCITNALSGAIEPVRFIRDAEGQLSRLLVCHPIIEGAETLGVVVIEESAAHVLANEEQRMRSIALKIASTLALLFLLLFSYALILARRIARLSHEASRSIDHHGRIEKTRLQSSRHFPDEIGDLSRSISTLLEKQHAYIRFLERIPQTLRHEISNPLNKLRTSLENLLDEHEALTNNPYIQKINKGIDQISHLTHQLTEAANLENAIQEEPLTRLNLIEFVSSYFSTLGPPVECRELDTTPVFILGDASRLEQLFDKLLDNAISFCPENGKVEVSLERQQKSICILITNDGPLLPVERSEDLFAPMVSTRSSGDSIHLGLGLHIAKLICDHHHAKLQGKNRPDGSGVIFSVTFAVI
jgi:signal transduction histidine kinase